MSAWTEIRRLQLELEEVQSSTTSHKLSERNCIEVVSKLIEMGLINVLFTMDGREYVVTSYLETEIQRELDAHKGRINTVDLQQVLNVDLVHIQRAVDSIVSNDPSILLIQGELIASDYKKTLCAQVNELLLQNGHVSLVDLSTSFGLPLSYITHCIESSLGTLIKGQLDKSGSGLLYTDLYVSRHRAKIRGTFSAVTRPTPIGPILQNGNYNENLFYSVLHELVSSGHLSGTVHGRSDKAIYIPSIYTEMQNQWIDNFLSSNGYLEYDAVSRLGVNDPVKFINQRYKSRDLLMLKTCCLATSVIDEVEGCVQEEVRSTEKWVDILPLLPAPCTVEDANVLLNVKYSNDPSLMVFGTVASHVRFIRDCQELFKPLLTERAQKAAVSSSSFLKQVSKDKEGVSEGEGGGKRGSKQQRKGKSGGRRGGGKEKDEPAESHWKIQFMNTTEISQVLLDHLTDLPEEFSIELADVLFRPLQQLFEEEAKRLLDELAEGEAGSQRKRHNVLSNQVQELWNRARLFEKGALKFEGETRSHLLKYLLKTLCTDMLNSVVSYVASDGGHKVPEDTPTLNKERPKIIKTLPEPVKQLATDVNGCLSGKDAEEFFVTFEKLCMSDSCGLMLKKLDKKKEKQLVYSHQQSLIDNLKKETDPAMTLHLTVVILFQQTNGCLLHTPGRLLPSILPQLKDRMDPSDYQLLTKLQDLVIIQLKTLQTSTVDPAGPTAPKDTPLQNTEDTPSNREQGSQKDTPSPLATTPSPVEGDWEMIKSGSSGEVPDTSSTDVVRSETTSDALKLLEEILEDKPSNEKDTPLEEKDVPLNEDMPSEKKDTPSNEDTPSSSEQVSVESDTKDQPLEGDLVGGVAQNDDASSSQEELDAVVSSVKDLVLRKRIKKS